MEFLYEDCKSLLEQVGLQEKELRHKRRWLIGLPTSGNETGKQKESKFQPERPIPECLLREDDVSFETVRSFVKNLVEECDSKKKNPIFHDDMQLIHSPTDIATLLYLIDNMTNLALFHFSKLLTGDSVKFEKTRWKMRQFIKEHLSKNNTRQIKLSNDQLSLLKNPKNFRWNPDSRFIPDSDSSHSAVHKILSILEDFPTQTLYAMIRKLNGTKNYIPKLIPKRCGWNRDILIKSLRKKCLRFLSNLNKGDSLQEPLAKSMEIAGLTLKMIQGHYYAPNFVQNPPEIIVLQNEIAMCIQLLDQDPRVKMKLLKEIQITLDPDAKLSKKTLPVTIVKNFLTEYLFECGDIDTIPLSLRKVIAIIRKSYKGNDKIDEDVDCILSVSASMKQVLWDVIPEHEFDLEFADVYMENLEESDNDDVFEDNEAHTENKLSNSSNFDEVGSSGENFDSVGDSDSVAGIGLRESYSMDSLKVSNSRGNGMQYHLVSYGNVEGMDTDVVLEENMDRVFDRDLCLERDLVNDDGGILGNRYLGVQGASDEVSMVAYRVIGCMLSDFARMEGCDLDSKDLCYLGVGSDYLKQKHNGAVKKTTHKEDDCSIMIKAVEQIIPSFSKSEADRLTELMDGF